MFYKYLFVYTWKGMFNTGLCVKGKFAFSLPLFVSLFWVASVDVCYLLIRCGKLQPSSLRSPSPHFNYIKSLASYLSLFYVFVFHCKLSVVSQTIYIMHLFIIDRLDYISRGSESFGTGF